MQLIKQQHKQGAIFLESNMVSCGCCGKLFSSKNRNHPAAPDQAANIWHASDFPSKPKNCMGMSEQQYEEWVLGFVGKEVEPRTIPDEVLRRWLKHSGLHEDDPAGWKKYLVATYTMKQWLVPQASFGPTPTRA